jgi:hypothetical protein
MEVTGRHPLPARRQSFNLKLEWRERGLNQLPWAMRPMGQKFFITVGFYDLAWQEVGDVFADIGKTPSSLQQIVSAACIIISVAIQCGVSLEELLKSQPRYDPTPDFPAGEHFTILGIILQVLVSKIWEREENENGSIDVSKIERAPAQDDQ